ncbi:MAG: hypothetical protein ACFFEE_07675, partial [Candidatus Thorarchaeota archaeon]
MIDRKKLRLLKVSVAVTICLGLTLVPIVAASLPGFPDTTLATIYEGDFAFVAAYDLIEGYQVYIEVTMIDPPPSTDLDAYVFDSTF